MIRLLPVVIAIPFAALPLFASFIMLVGIPVPGVSLIPTSVAIFLLVLMGCEAVYGVLLLLRERGEKNRLVGPLLLWLGSGLLAALFGFDPRGGLLFLGIFGLGIVWHMNVERFYDRPGTAKAIVWTLVVTSALASLLAIILVLSKHPNSLYIIARGRAVGSFVLPGELAGYLLMLLPLGCGVALTTRDLLLRNVAWVSVGIGAIAFALTYSRTAFVAMGVELAVAGFLILQGRRRIIALLGLILAMAITLVVFNAHHDPSENFTRPPIWQAALSMIERFPLTGVGPFGFGSIYQLVRAPDADAAAYHAHSIYLTLLAETGIVGFCAFLLVWKRFATETYALYSRATPTARILGVACIAAFAGTLSQGLIDTVSIVLFGLWLPFMGLTFAMLRHGLMESPT